MTGKGWLRFPLDSFSWHLAAVQQDPQEVISTLPKETGPQTAHAFRLCYATRHGVKNSSRHGTLCAGYDGWGWMFQFPLTTWTNAPDPPCRHQPVSSLRVQTVGAIATKGRQKRRLSVAPGITAFFRLHPRRTHHGRQVSPEIPNTLAASRVLRTGALVGGFLRARWIRKNMVFSSSRGIFFGSFLQVRNSL